jgi:phosphatidylglycerophosphate synthase
MAESALDLSRAVKPIDCWWTVIAIDPVAVRVLPGLLRFRRITPDFVTSVAFVVGVVAVGFFATGHHRIGAVVYELRFFLDCLDGKIARVRQTSSPFGAAFDRLADSLTIPAAYAAIGWVLSSQGHLDARFAFAPALMSAMVSVAELSLDLTRRAAGASAPVLVTASGVIAWMRRHRLTARPWTVEAETLGLFLGPLVLGGLALARVELAVAAVYVVFLAIDVALLLAEARRVGR